jgi:hypothetical protein
MLVHQRLQPRQFGFVDRVALRSVICAAGLAVYARLMVCQVARLK